jgi:hypothetical protein
LILEAVGLFDGAATLLTLQSDQFTYCEAARTLRLTGPNLPEGDYELRLAGARPLDTAGSPLRGGTNGMVGDPGDMYAFTFRVDHPPLAVEDAFTTDENTPLTIATAYPWHNSLNRLNVNDDGYVTPIDALLVINALNRGEAGKLSLDRARPLAKPFYDVNRDGCLSPINAFQVINHLNRGGGEGEADELDAIGTLTSISWAETVTILTHVNGTDTNASEQADGSTACGPCRLMSDLQSLDLLFAKLDDAGAAKNWESTVSDSDDSLSPVSTLSPVFSPPRSLSSPTLSRVLSQPGLTSRALTLR